MARGAQNPKVVGGVWTDECQAALERMAAEGLSGSEIGEVLGVTRNAILGRAHRTGVKLPATARKRARRSDWLSIRRRFDPEFNAKRVAGLRTPEARAKMSAARRAWWAARKAAAE